jgi:hypothetical protein
MLEAGKGIEPLPSGFAIQRTTVVLPSPGQEGIEPTSDVLETSILPLNYYPE